MTKRITNTQYLKVGNLTNVGIVKAIHDNKSFLSSDGFSYHVDQWLGGIYLNVDTIHNSVITPGTYSVEEKHYQFEGNTGIGYNIVSDAVNYGTFAQVDSDKSTGLPQGTAKATAFLFAASPILKEALIEIAEELDSREMNINSFEFKLWKIANDALKSTESEVSND